MFPPTFLGSGHSTLVLFVIHAQQVQDTVQHENCDFLIECMAEFRSLGSGTVDRNRDVAKVAGAAGWK